MTAAGSPVVAVTGVGAVSPWGWNVEALWRGLSNGGTAIGRFDRFDHRAHRTHVAGQVPAGNTDGRAGLSLAERFAISAAVEASSMAGFGSDPSTRDTGVVFASSTGGLFEAEDYYYADQRGEVPDRRQIVSHLLSAPGEAVARHLSLTGPVTTISSACASATLAIGIALHAIRDGELPRAIAGGADALCRTTYGGFNALRSVDDRPCRPFRKDRQGLSLGEGAAVLVLEPLDAALNRGVRPLAVLAGAGSSSDAHHMTAPMPDGAGAARAAAAALADAGKSAHEVDFVNAHGTGTPLNDAAEWNALHAALGERATRVPVTATKGSLGHYLGAAGAIEAVATVLCLERRLVHPTPAAGPIDDASPVRLVTGQPLPLPSEATALSLNLGFGGCNAALIIDGVPKS